MSKSIQFILILEFGKANLKPSQYPELTRSLEPISARKMKLSLMERAKRFELSTFTLAR